MSGDAKESKKIFDELEALSQVIDNKGINEISPTSVCTSHLSNWGER